MPTNLTEVSQFVTPISVPADGDTRNAASVNGAFQKLADRTLYLSNAVVEGAMVGGDTVFCTDYQTITVKPIKSLILSSKKCSSGGADLTYNVNGAGLSLSTRYYLYVYNNSGTSLALVASTTAPDSSNRFKSDDATRRFICSFYTNSADANYCLAFSKVNGQVILGHNISGSTKPSIVDSSTPGSFSAATSFGSGGLPTNVRQVLVELAISSAGDGTNTFSGELSVETTSPVAAVTVDGVSNVGGNALIGRNTYWVTLESGQQVKTKLVKGGGTLTGTFTVTVLGWND